jgi:tripeptide aminopeptidase
VPVVGLIAHVDTSPSASGENVKPQVIRYDGGDVTLPGDTSVVIRASENPALALNVGRQIVTSDGTTLLGADDKAGIAIIMTAVQELLADPKKLHGDIRIGFTPDEEVGAGTKFFNIKAFGASAAYTVDGDTPGELNKETFSADSAIITVHGRNIHPGSAKGIMVNALRVIADIIVRLPKDMAPETTEGYEPYIHPHVCSGEEALATLRMLLRDFEASGLKVQEQILRRIIAEVQPLHPKAKIDLEIRESYRNMHDGLQKDPRVTECLWIATERAGLKPHWVPIRGGTDGSRLTEKGLPTPNIFTGGQNYHGLTEWLSVDGMNQSVSTVVHLAQVWVEKSHA